MSRFDQLAFRSRFPAAYYQGKAYFFEPSDRPWFGYFGGPTGIQLTGVKHGSEPIHHVATLFSGDFEPTLSVVGSLPLFYGLRYCDCRLRYRFPESGKCRIEALTPTKSSSDWPYRDFPRLLPYIPMQVAQKVRCRPERFSELAPQGLELADDTLAVIIPPMAVGGVSLWGPRGDMEDVRIIFLCDLAKKRVDATNQCT